MQISVHLAAELAKQGNTILNLPGLPEVMFRKSRFTVELANYFPFYQSLSRALKKEVRSLKVYLERLKLLFNLKICTMLSPCPSTANVDELMCGIQEAEVWKAKFVVILAVVRINQCLQQHPVKEQSTTFTTITSQNKNLTNEIHNFNIKI